MVGLPQKILPMSPQPVNIASVSSQTLRAMSMDNIFSETPKIVPLKFVESLQSESMY